MKLQRFKSVSIVFSLVAACTFAAAWGITSAWSEHKNQNKYNRALALYSSADATERRLSVALLAQVQGKGDVIRLIGARLFDSDRANQLYAIDCLKVLVGDFIPLPKGAEVQPVSVVTQPPTAIDRQGKSLKFTDEAMDTYVLQWQDWYRNSSAANSSGQSTIIATKL